MSTIATLTSNESGANSLIDINNNFSALNTDKVEGQASSVDSEVALFSGTGGKTIKRASSTGIATLTSGVLSATATVGSGSVVLATSPTITTPTIASFANATHNHENSAGGGTLDEDALALTDVTTNNSSTSKHGFLKKLDNTATNFMNGAGNWAVPATSVTFTNGITTRDLSTASGNQTIAHGLGATPKYIKITAILGSTGAATNSFSFGVYNGTTTSNVSRGMNSNSQYFQETSSTNVISLYAVDINSTTPQVATVTFDGTNITLAWTKNGTPTTTAQILWEAIT